MSDIVNRIEQSTLAEVDSKPPSKLTIKTVGKGLGKAQQLQGPQVKKYVAGIRRRHPEETPQQIIERLETHYLRAVTSAASAVLPSHGAPVRAGVPATGSR